MMSFSDCCSSGILTLFIFSTSAYIIPKRLPATTPPNIKISIRREQRVSFTICAIKFTQQTLQVNLSLSPREWQLEETMSPLRELVMRLLRVETAPQNWLTLLPKLVSWELKLVLLVTSAVRSVWMALNRFILLSRQAMSVCPQYMIWLQASGQALRICTQRMVKSLKDQMEGEVVESFSLKEMQVTKVEERLVPVEAVAAQTAQVGSVQLVLSHTHTSLDPVATPPPWQVQRLSWDMAQFGLSLLVMPGLVSTYIPSLQLLIALIHPDITPVDMLGLIQLLLAELVQLVQVWMLVKSEVTVFIYWAIENLVRTLPSPNRQVSTRVNRFWVQLCPSRLQDTELVSIELKQVQNPQLMLPTDKTPKVTMITPTQASPQIVHPR